MKEIFKYKNFRVCTIRRCGHDGFYDVDVKEGLAIEYTRDGSYYCVIAFVYPEVGPKFSNYEPIGDRVEQSTPDWESVKIFRMCLEIARQEIKEAQKNEEEK